jgi:hypothetical protein
VVLVISGDPAVVEVSSNIIYKDDGQPGVGEGRMTVEAG